jgi:hypothetical protein
MFLSFMTICDQTAHLSERGPPRRYEVLEWTAPQVVFVKHPGTFYWVVTHVLPFCGTDFQEQSFGYFVRCSDIRLVRRNVSHSGQIKT